MYIREINTKNLILNPLQQIDVRDFEVSWVEFKTEQLENFNWNRMDFYVCTRGGDKVCSF
jgi:hypothetical protein